MAAYPHVPRHSRPISVFSSQLQPSCTVTTSQEGTMFPESPHAGGGAGAMPAGPRGPTAAEAAETLSSSDRGPIKSS